MTQLCCLPLDFPSVPLTVMLQAPTAGRRKKAKSACTNCQASKQACDDNEVCDFCRESFSCDVFQLMCFYTACTLSAPFSELLIFRLQQVLSLLLCTINTIL